MLLYGFKRRIYVGVPNFFCYFVIYFIFLMSIISLVIYQEVISTPNNQNFLAYDNPLTGIKIYYPSNWEKMEQGENNLRFSSPYESDLDSIRESLVINIQYLPFQNMFTLDEFVFDPEEGFIERAKRDLNNFQLIASDSMMVSNMPAYRLIFTETFMNEGVPHNLKEMFVFVSKNDLVYSIQYFAEPSNFNLYLPIVDKMIRSLQITR